MTKNKFESKFIMENELEEVEHTLAKGLGNIFYIVKHCDSI